MTDQVGAGRGASRRDFVKRAGVVAGAAVWATPAMQVIRMTGAQATDGSVVDPPPPPDQTVDCGGRVIDAGVPIVGAAVGVVGGGPSTQTNGSGEFFLTGVGTTDVLFVVADGYLRVEVPVTDPTGAVCGKVIELTPLR